MNPILRVVDSFLVELSRQHKLWLAYSGGVDSHVLLHFLATHPDIQAGALQAVHINHGINPCSAQWQTHCQQVCAALGVSLQCRSLQLDGRQNLEARARQGRYEAFAALLDEGDYLLTAHHQDDQAETMLYHLLRGSGVQGLSGMPAKRELGKGRLLRPLLACSRQDILAYARAHHLSWIEDDSNVDTGFDRNYLRQDVLPRVEARWPAYRLAWQRSAGLLADAEHCLRELAELDLAGVPLQRLPLQALQELSPERQRNALRYWLQRFTSYYNLPRADFHSMQRILDEVIPAREDAVPLVTWGSGSEQVELRRFAATLYLMQTRQKPFVTDLCWQLSDKKLDMGEELGSLALVAADSGLSLDELEQLEVRFRQPGLSAKPAGRRTRSLKKLFQDYQVPPWVREQVPLLFAGEELVAVGDLFICDRWLRKSGENLVRIHWQRSDLHCGY